MSRNSRLISLLIALAMLAAIGCSESSIARDAEEASHPRGGGKSSPKGALEIDDQPAQVSLPNQTADNDQFDWPHWRGPHGNDTSKETGLLPEFPASGPPILWRQDLGTGFSGLSIADGKLYTLFGEEGRERIACFDADTGREIWTIDSDADFAQGRSFGPRATPWVEGDRVFTVGASGMLFCLDASDGSKVWSFNIYDEFDMQRFVHEEGLSCSPTIDGDRLFVLAGNSAFAFDKRTGDLLWRSLDEKMNHSTPTLATLDGQRQLLALTSENLVGLDPETGRELWRHEQRGVNCASPVVGPHDQVFTAASYGFGCQAICVADGRATQVFKTNTLATHHATAVLHEGCLYGFHDRPGILKCIDFATGNEKWVSRQPGKGKMIFADGQLIIITEAGDLVLAPVSPEGFRQAAKARVLKGTCYTAPSLAGGRLFLRSDQEMICIQLKR